MIGCCDSETAVQFGEHAFSHAGPAAWNRLPETIRQTEHVSSKQARFKKPLKTFLFTEFFTTVV